MVLQFITLVKTVSTQLRVYHQPLVAIKWNGLSHIRDCRKSHTFISTLMTNTNMCRTIEFTSG